MQQMDIDSIRVSLLNYQRVVILRAKESNRCLPIWIGPAEADSIAMRLRNEDVPRPMTHDLVQSIISSLGATVGRIIVSDLSNDTFYAKIIIQSNGTQIEIDSRPSDAIALAVRSSRRAHLRLRLGGGEGRRGDGRGDWQARRLDRRRPRGPPHG